MHNALSDEKKYKNIKIQKKTYINIPKKFSILQKNHPQILKQIYSQSNNLISIYIKLSQNQAKAVSLILVKNVPYTFLQLPIPLVPSSRGNVPTFHRNKKQIPPKIESTNRSRLRFQQAQQGCD